MYERKYKWKIQSPCRNWFFTHIVKNRVIKKPFNSISCNNNANVALEKLFITLIVILKYISIIIQDTNSIWIPWISFKFKIPYCQLWIWPYYNINVFSGISFMYLWRQHCKDWLSDDKNPKREIIKLHSRTIDSF